MRQKTFFKGMLSVLLVSALVILGIVVSRGVAMASETATDTCTEAVWELYSTDTENKYSDYRTGADGYTAPTKENYVFSGWYNQENGTPLSEADANAATQAYAKFVPAHILTVKAQITDAWTYGQTETSNTELTTPVTTAAIRLITTVDTLKYQNMGFMMTIGESTYDSIVINEMNGNDTKNIVYSKLYAVGDKEGEPISFYPSSFCNLSKYFKTFTFTGIPVEDFNDYISAKAYWTTVDGTKVCGEESVKTVNLGRANGKATTEDTTFVNPFEALRESTISEIPYNLFYETLEGALAGTNGEDLTTAKIELIKDVDVDAQIAVDANLTDCTDIMITNCTTTLPVKSVESEVVLTKSVTTSGANMFNIASGYSLSLEGANAETKTGIKLDGNSKDTNASMISNKGTLIVKNATLENSTVTDGSGGAIASSATLIIDNAYIAKNSVTKNSASTQGGAINITAGTATITNTTFEENSSTKDGGAIRCGNAQLKIADCTFHANIAGKAGELIKNSADEIIGGAGENAAGGAIYMTGSASFTEDSLRNVFTENSAPKGGAISYNSTSTSGLTDCSFDNNSAYQYIVLTATDNTDSDGNKIYTSKKAEGNAGAVLANNGTLQLENTSFTGNVAATQGGAINIAGTLIANDCTFVGNTASTDGGAIRCAKTMEINNCTFDSNESKTMGGAIYLTVGTSVIQNSKGNCFIGNVATNSSSSYGFGGAVYVANGTCTVNGWEFEGNSASTSGNDIAVATGKTLNISDSIFNNGEVTLRMSGTSVGVANVAGELKDVTFRYYGYDGTSTISSGVTVSEANINELSDIAIIPYTYAEGVPVVFGNLIELTDAERERFGATSKGDGKHFGIDADGELTYVPVAKIGDVSYDTFQEALTAAATGDTITLLRDSEYHTARIDLSKNVTIQNVADRTIIIHKYAGAITSSNLIKVNSGYSLTIQSNGGNRVIFDGRSADEAVSGAIASNKAAALLYTDGGTITLKGVTMQHANSTGQGGAIQAKGAGVLNITDCSFISNTTTSNAGAVCMLGTATLNATNCSFVSNSTTASKVYGGAVFVNSTGDAEFTNCNFSQNTTATNGGAIYQNAAGTITISESEFSQNTATTMGGAIYQNAAGTITITNTKFCKNSATQGGAVRQVENKGILNITNSTFEENIAGTNGGAIRADGTTLNITDCNFISNQAATTGNGNGGAIYCATGVNAVVDATEYGKYVFKNNTASRGASNKYTWGAIAAQSTGEVRYSGKYIFENNTHGTVGISGKGVGVHADGKVLIQINNADSYESLVTAMTSATTDHPTEITMTGDIVFESRIDIGAKEIVLSNAEDTSVNISVIEGGYASGEKSLFAVRANGSLSIIGNDSNVRTGIVIDAQQRLTSGLIYAPDGTTILQNITVSGANAGNYGGVVDMRAGTLSVDNCLFDSNKATYGGVFSLQGGTATISDTDFTNNTSTNYGGAIYNKSTGTDDVAALTISNCTFGKVNENGEDATYSDGNSSASGGAVYTQEGILNITDCDFYGNIATKTSSIAYGGGAICLLENGSINLTGAGEFAGNSTDANGGAVYTNGGSISISGYDFVKNSGTAAGGALRLRVKYDGDAIRVENCNFLNNDSSGGQGGAIYLSNAPTGFNTKLILAGTGTFSGNTCKSTAYGSAIAIADNNNTLSSVYYEDSNASYTFDNQTVQYANKTDYTIDVLTTTEE